jgi:dephospho-CoA kinase
MKFKDFLIKEEKEKHAVLAFGRMNPPTTGHAVLVDKVHEIAGQHNATHHVVLSHSQDKAKNPLTSSHKLKHAQRFFPKTSLSVATKEHPNFLEQAKKLHKKGVTHLHMVAGSDRVPEYHKLLHKYNGTHEGALFNFKHIKVHSAGERDPDAEGTSGMSASKMRAHATSGNYKEFKKGIPAHVKDHHAKELYNDVRKGMNIKEQFKLDIPLDELFEQHLSEGVHDKGIFKAVFLAGGPGSGKDYVLSNTLDGHGLTEINSDKALEYLMDKEGLDKTMPANEREVRDMVRGRAKNVTDLKQRLALMGRNGLIINGTGDDLNKITKIKERLEEMGYETSMVAVNTADEVSQQRNIERGKSGGRTVPENIRKQKWEAVQNARPEFAKLFGQNYVEFDNSEDLRSAKPEVVKAKKDEMLEIFKKVKEFVSKPTSNDKSKLWIASELSKKDTLPVPKDGAEKAPNTESGAYKEAMKLGLKYYGFGRYGQDGKVTYHSVHDKLVKTVNESFEEMMNESVTVSVTGDTPEEVARTLQLLSNDPIESEVEESYLSDNVPTKALTLGKPYEIIDIETTSGSSDIGIKTEENKSQPKYLTDKNGKVRQFILRSAAAKEGHLNGGTVVKSGKSYIIKLKEEYVSISKKLISEEVGNSSRRRTASSGYTSGGVTASDYTESSGETQGDCSGTKTKISLSEAKKKYIKEIDAGTEIGLPMSGTGENMLRGKTSNRILKKPMDELTGDETTYSIGDKKEDELGKVGIALSTFKSKNYL